MFKLHQKFGAILSQSYKDMTLYQHMYQNVYGNLLQKKFSILEWPLYKRLELEKYGECFIYVLCRFKGNKEFFSERYDIVS